METKPLFSQYLRALLDKYYGGWNNADRDDAAYPAHRSTLRNWVMQGLQPKARIFAEFKSRAVRIPSKQLEKLTLLYEGNSILNPAIPKLPPGYIDRPQQEIIEQLLSVVDGDEVVAVDELIVRGWPGGGKSSICFALAHDFAVQAYFMDGIYLVSLGKLGENDIPSKLRELARQLSLSLPENIALDDMRQRIHDALLGQKALVIVDDFHDCNDYLQFKHTIKGACPILATTRYTREAECAVDGQEDHLLLLNIMNTEEGLQLFYELVPALQTYFTDEKIIELHNAMEGLPLAIRAAASRIREDFKMGPAVVSKLIETLLQSYYEVIQNQPADTDRFDEVTGMSPTIRMLLDSSVQRLSVDMQNCYAMMGAFAPKPYVFDLDALQFVWEAYSQQPVNVLRELIAYGFIEPVDSEEFWMHSIFVGHAKTLWSDPDGGE